MLVEDDKEESFAIGSVKSCFLLFLCCVSMRNGDKFIAKEAFKLSSSGDNSKLVSSVIGFVSLRDAIKSTAEKQSSIWAGSSTISTADLR